MKNYVKVAALLGLSAVTLSASGWRIPEQSLSGTALSAAYVAGANGADASYYNPANMVWNEDISEIEMATTIINLTKINYTDDLGISAYNGQTESELFFMPTFHYVSPAAGNWRFGLSMVAPGGLSKRWENTYQKSSAEEFSLQVLELNPTVAYKINDKFSIGFGLRGVYTSGVIKAEGTFPLAPFAGKKYDNEMKADSIDFGYNLAMSYKPIENLILSSTYRSNVDLTVSGDATTKIDGVDFSGDVETHVPLPAVVTLAAQYTISKTKVEFVFERTYWSAYDSLQFKFANQNVFIQKVLGAEKAKNWKDVDAYRVGVTHQYNENLTLMAGFAIDKNPAPDEHVSFELPDSDAKLYSVGVEYKLNDSMKIGLAYLYDQKERRSVNTRINPANPATGIDGKFEDASAHLLTASFKYKF